MSRQSGGAPTGLAWGGRARGWFSQDIPEVVNIQSVDSGLRSFEGLAVKEFVEKDRAARSYTLRDSSQRFLIQ
jgi:hypothetical protein